MDRQTFEALLWQQESDALDFKKEQYKFDKAPDEERSELVKDILAMANAWRQSNGYIIIGVEEVRGGRSIPHGIPIGDHLQDHSLQQFITYKTNRPVRFSYEVFDYDGAKVGVITIPKQERPRYLKHDFGKLKKNEVWVRRGSASIIATIEEIAQMGEANILDSTPIPALRIELLDWPDCTPLVCPISLDLENCTPPKVIPTIKDLVSDGIHSDADFTIHLLKQYPCNNSYLSEKSTYLRIEGMCVPFGLRITNISKVSAQRLRLELHASEMTMLFPHQQMVTPPQLRPTARPMTSLIDQLRTLNGPPAIHVRNTPDGHYSLMTDYIDLQPGRPYTFDKPFLLTASEGEKSLSGKLYCDNLPVPQDVSLEFRVTVSQRQLTLEDLLPDIDEFALPAE